MVTGDVGCGRADDWSTFTLQATWKQKIFNLYLPYLPFTHCMIHNSCSEPIFSVMHEGDLKQTKRKIDYDLMRKNEEMIKNESTYLLYYIILSRKFTTTRE